MPSTEAQNSGQLDFCLCAREGSSLLKKSPVSLSPLCFSSLYTVIIHAIPPSRHKDV